MTGEFFILTSLSLFPIRVDLRSIQHIYQFFPKFYLKFQVWILNWTSDTWKMFSDSCYLKHIFIVFIVDATKVSLNSSFVECHWCVALKVHLLHLIFNVQFTDSFCLFSCFSHYNSDLNGYWKHRFGGRPTRLLHLIICFSETLIKY